MSPSPAKLAVFECDLCKIQITNKNEHFRSKEHKLLKQWSEDQEFSVEACDCAFKSRIASYRIYGSKKTLMPAVFFNVIEDKVIYLWQKVLENHTTVKVNLELFSIYELVKNDCVKDDLKSFNTRNKVICRNSDLAGIYKEFCEEIVKKSEEFQERDSGWSFKNIEFLEVNINRLTLFNGASYIPLPPWISKKKACVNLKNEDACCFAWSIIAATYPVSKSCDRISSYPHFSKSRWNFKGLSYPVSVNDLKLFEKQNKDISFNIYGLKDNEIVGPLYLSNNKCGETHVNLLYFENSKGGGHYCWIKSLSRLLTSQLNKHKGKLFFCNQCLLSFRNQALLAQHLKYGCAAKRIELPDAKNKLSFRNQHKMLSVPFVIYADFESILLSVENDAAAQKNTKSMQKHVPFSFAYYIQCNYDGDLSKFNMYRGEDCVTQFVECIHSETQRLSKHIFANKPMIPLTEAQQVFAKFASKCHICEEDLNGDIVYDHCHITGNFRGVCHSLCNLHFKTPTFIPIIFHNLSGYDTHLFIKELASDEAKLECIAQNKERYISFSKTILCDNGKMIKLKFIDSFKFMSSSLEKLAKNLNDSQFQILRKYFPKNDDFSLVRKKGIFPYDYLDCWEKLNDVVLPSKNSFFSMMNNSDVKDEEYNHALSVWTHFNIENLGSYSDLYLKTDVLLLADVFENFRNVCQSNYKLDPCQYLTAPGLSWDAALKFTQIELDYLTDYDMIRFIQLGTRGGICQVNKRYSKANNKYMEQYNPHEKDKYIVYLDANNLYGWAMSQFLPQKSFRWLSQNEIAELNIEMIANDSSIGYLLEVDLEISKELHDLQNCYPFCPENKPPPGSKQEKLLLTLENKTNYVMHYRNLQQVLKHGIKLIKVHRVLSFTQSAWLKPYIDLNTSLRSKACNPFEKDFYKLMNNSVFGKTMENVEKRTTVHLCTHWDDIPTTKKCKYGARRYIAQPNFHSCKVFNENFVAIQMHPVKVLYDKPIYIGCCVLELSKTLMYDFHYDFMLPKYNGSIKLLYTDTDSFIYEIFTPDFYDDIKKDLSKFDTSDYDEQNIYNLPLVNKKVLGLMKDECAGKIIREFVGLRPKLYSYCLDNNFVVKKAKGVKSGTLRNVKFDSYVQCLNNKEKIFGDMYTFRSNLHTLTTEKTNKCILSVEDNKRFHCQNEPLESLAYGHFRII